MPPPSSFPTDVTYLLFLYHSSDEFIFTREVIQEKDDVKDEYINHGDHNLILIILLWQHADVLFTYFAMFVLLYVTTVLIKILQQ